MSVTFELPSPLEEQLRRELGDLDQLAKEAVLVELYRQAKLTHHGLSRFATEDLLKRYGVTEDLPTIEEFQEQSAMLRKLLGS